MRLIGKPAFMGDPRRGLPLREEPSRARETHLRVITARWESDRSRERALQIRERNASDGLDLARTDRLSRAVLEERERPLDSELPLRRGGTFAVTPQKLRQPT
jgi:hypothetical protein